VNLYEYNSYDEYKTAQISGNKRTINAQWVIEEEIHEASIILLKKVKNIEFGICHGARQGNEQAWFSRYLGAEVLGTDISTTATDFPNTIEWDFHDVKPEWVGNVDFIYSNALDHSYDPEMCLRQWMNCLKPGGYCILHWSVGHTTSCARDPFGAELSEYRNMILSLGYILDEETEQEHTKRLLWVRHP
jgi:hypothetical protein